MFSFDACHFRNAVHCPISSPLEEIIRTIKAKNMAKFTVIVGDSGSDAVHVRDDVIMNMS